MKCKICGNSQDNEFFTVKELMFGYKDEFQYFKCGRCGCLQIAEIPANISTYYPEEYYSFISEPVNYKVNPLAKWVKKKRDNFALFNKGLIGKLLFKVSPNYTLACLSKVGLSKESRILDVGCGSGGFLHTLKELGFTDLLGIDPYITNEIRYDNGLLIEKKSIHEQDGQWDIIMLHHSFEHVPDQFETLDAISKLMAPGGICLIRIPTVSSFAWEKYKENWVQLDAPRHFFLHSINSIELLAAKAGMKVTQIEYDSNDLQFWGSEQYIKGIPLRRDGSPAATPSVSLFKKSDIRRFKEQAKKLNAQNLGDQAAFYLEKQI